LVKRQKNERNARVEGKLIRNSGTESIAMERASLWGGRAVEGRQYDDF
jgi:hypothetical protein